MTLSFPVHRRDCVEENYRNVVYRHCWIARVRLKNRLGWVYVFTG